MAINRVVIEGNLTRDTDVRDLANGTKVCNFTVAVNEKRKNVETGEWEDAPVFVRCALFGLRAEKLSQYLLKGTKVRRCAGSNDTHGSVRHRLHLRQYLLDEG